MQAAISLENADLYSDLQQENIERKRAEEELQRSEAFLAEGRRISHTGSWGWNISTGKLVWSEEHSRIFGFDPTKAEPTFQFFPKQAPSGGIAPWCSEPSIRQFAREAVFH